MRVGALDVSILVDAERSFATFAEAFPALDSHEEWRLPVNAVLVRGVIVDHFHGPGRFSRKDEGFSWSGLAEEGETAVE